jgi:hypothetical protein
MPCLLAPRGLHEPAPCRRPGQTTALLSLPEVSSRSWRLAGRVAGASQSERDDVRGFFWAWAVSLCVLPV